MIKDFSWSKIIANKGYDANSLIEQLQQQNCEAVIPPKKNRKEQRFYDSESYKERHLIECFFWKTAVLSESFLSF